MSANTDANHGGVEHFDHVLIGTGQAAGTLVGALPSDETIAIVEGEHVGGTCVNDGCTPTKTLIASAKVAHQARRSDTYGVTTGPVEIDWPAVRARMNELRHGARDGLTRWFEEASHITLIRGWAAFEAPKVLRVGERRITGDRIYLNVGARARVPDLPGLDEVPWLDNTRILDLEEVPRHLLVVGGSYVGLEFAQAFRRFGAEVTVLERGPRLMSREDEDIADTAREILEDDGITVLCDAEVRRVRAGRDGPELEVAHGDTERVVAGSHLLLAVGRVPNSDRLNLRAAGIETDARGYIQVDDQLRTTAEGVFAVGDVNGQGAFTHTAVNDAEIVLDERRGGPRRLSTRTQVYAMFIDPPLGRAGLSRREAIARGHRVLEATRPMAKISRAKEMAETKGMVRILVDADTERILGAAVLGVYGDELANTFALFMQTGASWKEFRRTVLVHPTIGELMPWILDGLAPVGD